MAIEETPEFADAPLDEEAAVNWARAVMWAAERVNVKRLSVKQAGSASLHAMWQFGRDDPKALMVQLVPKALNILDKNRGDGPGADVVDAEMRSVKELQELLAGALAESQLGV